MANSSIRIMQESDIPIITAIERADPYSPWSESLIKDCLNREHYYNWVLAEATQLKGYIIYNIPYDECHLMNIAVAASWRGKGYGRQLLEYAISAVRRKAKYMILEVRAENTIARCLYESLGFKHIGLRRNYYQGDSNRDALVYRLELTVNEN